MMATWNEKSLAAGRPAFKTDADSFKHWIVNEMEERLETLPNLGYEEGEPNVKVAIASLAFKNGVMIDLLRQRGGLIKAEKWDKLKEIEAKINVEKDKTIEDLCRPCSVFMTFESEEGYNRALNYHQTIEDKPEEFGALKFWLAKHEIEIQEASEPSDIIWENRQITPAQRTKKGIIVFIIVALMLAVSFVIIFVLTNMSNEAVNKYPIVTDCTALAGYDDYDHLLEISTSVWKQNQALEELGKPVSYKSGYVQCFCIDRAAEEDAVDVEYGDENLKICEDYWASSSFAFIISNVIMVVIIGINTVIRMAAIALITWIRYDTMSEQMTKITNGVFIALFFNTGILLILSNANFSDVSTLLGKFFDGTHYDYSPNWYASVGAYLVSTMNLNAFMPPVYEGIANAQIW